MAEGTPTRTQFGSRVLNDPSRVYEHNAWDNVEWGDDLEQQAEQSVRENSTEQLSQEVNARYEAEAALYWDSFYQQHQNRFFKDRHWLFTEFPELKGNTQPDSGAARDEKFTIFEVGCGAGNTVFPILQTNMCPGLFVYCCDFAASAVQIVKDHPLCDPARCLPFQCDITSNDPLPFPPASIDLIILIFVLSAIQPSKMQLAVDHLAECLKPGGRILFRDYGRYDMAQLRFKKGQCLAANFYVRGDGTRVYFFTEGHPLLLCSSDLVCGVCGQLSFQHTDEVSSLFSKAGLCQEQLYVDRRLQVNRGRQLKMYRVWIQAKYRKPDRELGSLHKLKPERV